MKAHERKMDGMQLRLAGPGLIALLGSEDGRALAQVKRRLAWSRGGSRDLFPKCVGPRHD
jgi:hypothetical protein